MKIKLPYLTQYFGTTKDDDRQAPRIAITAGEFDISYLYDDNILSTSKIDGNLFDGENYWSESIRFGAASDKELTYLSFKHLDMNLLDLSLTPEDSRWYINSGVFRQIPKLFKKHVVEWDMSEHYLEKAQKHIKENFRLRNGILYIRVRKPVLTIGLREESSKASTIEVNVFEQHTTPFSQYYSGNIHIPMTHSPLHFDYLATLKADCKSLGIKLRGLRKADEMLASFKRCYDVDQIFSDQEDDLFTQSVLSTAVNLGKGSLFEIGVPELKHLILSKPEDERETIQTRNELINTIGAMKFDHQGKHHVQMIAQRLLSHYIDNRPINIASLRF